MEIVPRSKTVEPIKDDEMVVYDNQVAGIVNRYPEFSGLSKSRVGQQAYQQSRDYYNGQALKLNLSILEFENQHPFVFQQPNSLQDACMMLKDNAIAMPIHTSGAVVRGVLSAGGVLLGIFSGVIQRFVGGTGLKFQQELCEVLGGLLKAFAIDLPIIIKKSIRVM